MAIKIEIGANSTRVGNAQSKANEAYTLAEGAQSLARTADNTAASALRKAQENVSALDDAITDLQAAIDNVEGEIPDIDAEEIQRKIDTATQVAEACSESISDISEALVNMQRDIDSADGKAQEAIDAVDDIDTDAIAAQAASSAVSTIETDYGLQHIVETIDDLGTTYVAINDVGTGKRFDFATPEDLDDVHDTLDERINQIEEQGVSDQQIQNAIENWENPPIAMKSEVRDDIRIGVTDAKDSIMQEVGDMVEGAREAAADEIDFDQIVIPTVDEENSSNESFNELMSKLQEKPMRRADVLKKIIDEDAFYWYVMPIIDQRIYRDTVVNGVIVEAGWQKAVKERFWYHKQDKDIRDNYIYLFRSDINQMIAKATEENTASNDKPQLMPLSGNPRQLRKKNELPSGLPVLGVGKKEIGGRKINQTVKVSTPKKTLGGLTKIPVSRKLEASTLKPSPVLPSWAEQGKEITISDPTNIIINSSISQLPAVGKRVVMPYKSPAEWAAEAQSAQDKKDLANGNYPSDFYYIACYAECDDSSMYENGWFKLTDQGEADTTIGELIYRPETGTYYYEEWIDDSGSGSGGYYKEIPVTLDHRARFFVKRDEDNVVTQVLWRMDDTGTHDWPQAQRRSFADVSRDIKVYMLPIYLLGSTIIAIDSDDVDNDGKFNYVTIDSMISPALPESYSTSTADAPKAKKVVLSGSEVQLQDSDHKSDGTHPDGRYRYVCRDNVRMGESGLPCVYGQGYTWLPLDAKGTADDKGGLGIHCQYTQQQMWVADGVYSYYNGLIPSGYTKETLKNLTTMYKYKIVEKFIVGSWQKTDPSDPDSTIETSWVNKDYPKQSDGRIDQTQQASTETYPNMINIFVEDYSEDNIADLSEDIFDINIDDEYISYTIKDGMIVQDGADGGATVSNFIYDTLSYLTEKGKVNTNNIFLICVEDDGDEYIFDEYIWEKGKVLKLNEQKRIKYSEELRKIEYVQATSEKPIGQSPNQYTGGVVTGTDRDEKSENILNYLTTITRVPSGATMTNPNYIPAQEGYLAVEMSVQGRIPGDIKNTYQHSIALNEAIIQFYVNDIIPELAATLKLAAYIGITKNNTNIRNLFTQFINTIFINAGDVTMQYAIAGADKIANGKTKLQAYKPYYTSFANNARDIITKMRNIADANTFINFISGEFMSVFNENKNTVPNIQPANTGGNGNVVGVEAGSGSENIANYYYLYAFDYLIYVYLTNAKGEGGLPMSCLDALANFITKIKNIIYAIKEETASYQDLIDCESRLGEGYYGYILNSPVYSKFVIKSRDVADTPAQGDSTVDVLVEKRVPIQTNGTDYLQKYNKILAFLIERNSIGEGTTGYEYVYSLWRYMPTVKQYATVGSVSIISNGVPDLNSKDVQNEVGQAGAVDTHSEIANAVNVARQDIISRFDHLLTEDGILSKMPKLKGILEQNFVSETVEGVTSFKMKNVATRDDLELAVQRQSSIETNMASFVSAVNSGKRAQFVNGSISATNDNIFTGATVNPSDPPTAEAPDAIVIPKTSGTSIQIQAPTSQSNSYSFNPNTSSMTRRIFV